MNLITVDHQESFCERPWHRRTISKDILCFTHFSGIPKDMNIFVIRSIVLQALKVKGIQRFILWFIVSVKLRNCHTTVTLFESDNQMFTQLLIEWKARINIFHRFINVGFMDFLQVCYKYHDIHKANKKVTHNLTITKDI